MQALFQVIQGSEVALRLLINWRARGESWFRGNLAFILSELLHLSKRQIVELGRSLGVDYSLTLSCYDPTADGEACGRCDACTLRLKGFAEAGSADPASYASA